MRTIRLVVRRPRLVWDEVRIVNVRASFEQAAATMVVPAVVYGAIASLVGLLVAWAYGYSGVGLAIQSFIFIFVVSWVVLMLLVCLQAFGLWVFARWRGSRSAGRVAWVIVAHASIGWIAGAAVLFVGTAVVISIPPPTPGIARGIADRLVGAVLYGHPLIGLVAFETLVYIGWRRLRFANREGGRDGG